MFRMAYLEKFGDGSLRHEETLVLSVLQARGVEVAFFTQKQIDRRSLPLADDTFIMGNMDVMHGAMKQLGIPPPQPDDYPASLQPYLHRRVWRATLRDVEHQVWSEHPVPVFAKPADRRKAFTGRVFQYHDDLYYLGTTSRRQAVLCSEVVQWSSEYRVYVIDAGIAAVSWYSGERAVELDLAVVNGAIARFAAAGQAPCAYGIDFGVLVDGRTALIEANDGYALGAYEVDAAVYTELLLRRWAQLLSMRDASVSRAASDGSS